MVNFTKLITMVVIIFFFYKFAFVTVPSKMYMNDVNSTFSPSF